MTIQSAYRKHEQAGWPGGLVRPNEPHAFHRGKVYVPSNGRKPQPGDPVYYDAARNAYALPTNAATSAQVIGIVSYDPGVVQADAGSTPSGANSDLRVEFADGAIVKVLVLGTVYAVAGEALEYGDLAEWNRTDHDWDKRDVPSIAAAAAVAPAPATNSAANIKTAVDAGLAALKAQITAWEASLHRLPVQVVSPSPAASGGLVELHLGSGRVI